MKKLKEYLILFRIIYLPMTSLCELILNLQSYKFTCFGFETWFLSLREEHELRVFLEGGADGNIWN
jgi:hypothetical protein